MLILSLDTTTKTGSCALARDGRVLREDASDAERGHAERLPGDLARLLDRERVALSEIDVFAVATGPGSFTGLRIGIATMQGLAMATGKPLIGVSALDALATLAGEPTIATWIDAWRGEVYAALYQDGREVQPPIVSRPEPLLADLRDREVLFMGDGAATFRDLIETTLGPRARVADPIAPPLAGAIAVLATAAAQAGHAPPPHAIRPLYVRRPDPELARARGPQGSAPHGNGSAPHP